MKKEFEVLKETINRKCASKSVYFAANPGNWGDGLIREGALQFLRDTGIDFMEVKARGIAKDSRKFFFHEFETGVVIYGGGAGWTKFWRHSEKYVRRINKRHEVIVLPSTFGARFTIPGVTFFSRDRYDSMTHMPDSLFCHDMAFYLRYGNYMLRFKKNRGSGVGVFFRTDEEQHPERVAVCGNNDISLKGNHYTDVRPFFEEINQYEVIHTDRLHVAIAGCLLDKQVHIYPTAFFKSKAIFNSSISSFFSKVYLHKVDEVKNDYRD